MSHRDYRPAPTAVDVLIGWAMLLGVMLVILGVMLALGGSKLTFLVLLPGIALTYWTYMLGEERA